MLLRWLGGIVVALVLVALIGLAAVVSVSDAHMRSYPRPPAFEHPIPTDAAAIAHGDHLVKTRGCRGCHGEDLAGQIMWGTAVAPNLAKLAHSETPATLEAAIRHGIGHDGVAFYSMPSFGFLLMTDADIAAMIAYLRTVPVVEKKLPKPSMPFATRLAIAMGADKPIAGFLHMTPPLSHQNDPDPRVARGEYTAMTTCNECHGFTLRKDYPWADETTAPDLVAVAGSYSPEEFHQLMRTGKGVGNRELPRMSGVARGRFAHFTDEEIADLFAYLQKRGEELLSEPPK